jgi:hypothetical protein
MDRPIIFKCSRTGLNVQHWIPSDGPEGTYVPVVCQACTGVHFVDRSTGQLLGDKHT